MNEYAELQEQIDRIVEATGIDLARKTDYAVKKALKEQAPRAYWLLSHFPFRWLSRMMGFEIIRHMNYSMGLDHVLEFKIYGKTIGRADINIALDII
jgi:hypothetical protein